MALRNKNSDNLIDSIKYKIRNSRKNTGVDFDEDEEDKRKLYIPLVTMIICFTAAIILIIRVIGMMQQDDITEKLLTDTASAFDEAQIGGTILTIESEKMDGSIETEVEEDETPVTYNYQALQNSYPNATMFIKIENTNIAYPIMWSEEEGYYLNHSVDGTPNRNGSIYLSPLNKSDLSDPINYIFGHNMRSGLMFRGLNNYLKAGYLADHNKCNIVTPEGTRHYILFAAESVSSDFSMKIYSEGYVGTEEYTNYIRSITQRTGAYCADDARLIVLVTCTTSNHSNRTVVYGYLDSIDRAEATAE